MINQADVVERQEACPRHRFAESLKMPKSEHQPIVLVVEDEMVLRMRALDIVEDAGFLPIEAANADQALEILESRDDISLLFTDIQMPGSMDGLMLAHAVHARWPQIKIILVSGQVAVTDADKPLDSRFFPKPLEIEEMIGELRSMVAAGTLKIAPVIVAPAAAKLAATNAELREMLDRADIDAKAQLIQTVLESEKQQLIIDEKQPFQDALASENDSLKLALEQAGIDAAALLVQSGIDAEERDAADKLQHLIHAELHHRIKNMLATVGAITHQSLRTATSMQHATLAINGRLAALARTHDLLTQVSWTNAALSETIRSATEPFDQGVGRFKMSGPEINITSGSVIALAMTLNELCTNTTKFGSLSTSEGRVDIVWSTEGERFRFQWIETNGPPITTQPSHRSFGTRMMTSLGGQMNGTVDLDYRTSGFVYSLNVPLKSLVSNPAK